MEKTRYCQILCMAVLNPAAFLPVSFSSTPLMNLTSVITVARSRKCSSSRHRFSVLMLELMHVTQRRLLAQAVPCLAVRKVMTDEARLDVRRSSPSPVRRREVVEGEQASRLAVASLRLWGLRLRWRRSVIE